jgi:hypothetical protein
MERSRTVLIPLVQIGVVAGLLAAVFAPTSGAGSRLFKGDVCALVAPAAARAAGVDAPCVPSKAAPSALQTYVATWGNSPTAADHFMSVQVGPVSSTGLRPNKLFPRAPGKLRGPVTVGPGVKAYYSLSAYGATVDGRGSMRFVDKNHLVQLTLSDASGNVLSGLEAVATAIALKM